MRWRNSFMFGSPRQLPSSPGSSFTTAEVTRTAVPTRKPFVWAPPCLGPEHVRCRTPVRFGPSHHHHAGPGRWALRSPGRPGPSKLQCAGSRRREAEVMIDLLSVGPGDFGPGDPGQAMRDPVGRDRANSTDDGLATSLAALSRLSSGRLSLED